MLASPQKLAQATTTNGNSKGLFTPMQHQNNNEKLLKLLFEPRKLNLTSLMELSKPQTYKCSNDRLTISFASYEHAISVNASQGNSLVIDVTPEQMTASFLKSVGNLSIDYHESKRRFVKELYEITRTKIERLKQAELGKARKEEAK